MTTQEADNLKETILVLIAACGDKEEFVNNAFVEALIKIASVYPNEVIEYFCDFYKSLSKVNNVQLGNVIKVLEHTCVNHMRLVRDELPRELVRTLLGAMTRVDGEPAVQLAASAVLVAVGHRHLDLTLESLMKSFSGASVPHYSVAHTLGTLAAVNSRTIVSFVKDILANMLPLLSLVKQDGTKQAFAYAFGNFAVAVSEQIGDNVEDDNITSIKENFVTEFTLIFDVLYNQWLHSYEAKVSESVLEALGPITRLISERKFDEIVNRFVMSLLAMYKKTNINFYYVSQCISYLLTPSPLNPKLSLNDSVINSINHTLFGLVVLEPDYDQPQTVKNHFEVLRSFDHMAGQFPDSTIESLLHQCKNNQEKDRMRAVIILTHLTTSSQAFVERFAAKFFAILKVMSSMEQAVKMKKLLVKAIVGLIYRNCITSAEDFHIVTFIVKHCASDMTNVSYEDLNDLHDACKSSLILLCNSAINLRTQLRDLLLNSLIVEELTPSMSIVSQCLTTLLRNEANAENDEKCNYVADHKISPDLIFVRCLTHLAEPDQVERNMNLLIFLDEYSGDVHKNLKTAWAVEVERLRKFVMKNEPNDQWHGMLLDLLSSAIEQVNSHKWVESISSALSQQILSTKQTPMIKGVSLQYLAILSCHMTNAAIVEQILKIILLALKSVPMESVEYVSKAIGIASRQHGEYVMNELDAFYKDIESKRGLKILNFISSRNSKTEIEANISKCAVITCYGKVAEECLDVHVLGRLGENVTGSLHGVLQARPPLALSRASLAALEAVSRALRPAAHHQLRLRNRWQLLNAVLDQLANPNLGKRSVELYPIIVKASKGLTKLQKGILPEERNTILRVLFNSIFGELSSLKRKFEDEENGDENDLLAKTLNDSLTLLHDLIRELIVQSTCLSTLDDVVALLAAWLRHESVATRVAACHVLHLVLDTYIRNVRLNFETPSQFGQLGYLVGLVVPGAADGDVSVRVATLECVAVIVQIQYLYEGRSVEPDEPCLAELARLGARARAAGAAGAVACCGEVCAALVPGLPHHQLLPLVESLLEGAAAGGAAGAGAAEGLRAVLALRGRDLFQRTHRIVECALAAMEAAGGAARGALLPPLVALARHHPHALTAVLLAQKIPMSQCVSECWRALAREPELSATVLDHFLRLMESAELFEEPCHDAEQLVAALQPLTLISALGEMCGEHALTVACVERFPALFSALYVHLAAFLRAAPPAYRVPRRRSQERLGLVPNRDAARLSPANIATDAFNAFLDLTDCHKVREACALCLSVEPASLLQLAPALGSALCVSCPARLPACAHSLAGYARSPLPLVRVAALALLSSLLEHRCNDNPVLVESVSTTLLAGCKDEDDAVRACSLRGVAHVGGAGCAGALSHALAALSEGIDARPATSPVDNVPLAAIQGLGQLLVELPALDAPTERELLAVAQKIRPYMGTQCAQTREHALRLFGTLCARCGAALATPALAALPCFLLQLGDASPAVVRASKYALKQSFAILNTPRANELVQTHLVDEGRLLLDEFLAALLRQLARERPAGLPPCLQAASSLLHAAAPSALAPLLVGKLYSELAALRTADPALPPVDSELVADTRAALLRLARPAAPPAAPPSVRAHAAAALADQLRYTSLLR